jgi:hypothetical protein
VSAVLERSDFNIGAVRDIEDLDFLAARAPCRATAWWRTDNEPTRHKHTPIGQLDQRRELSKDVRVECRYRRYGGHPRRPPIRNATTATALSCVCAAPTACARIWVAVRSAASVATHQRRAESGNQQL